MEYTAYYDRREDTIDGLFTLQKSDNGSIQPITYNGQKMDFVRLQARSGQKGYENTNGVRGKSPIPQGRWHLWLTPLNRGQQPGAGGVGEFFPISSSLTEHTLLQSPGGTSRIGIGLHKENDYEGSAGCVVLLHHRPEFEERIDDLFAFLRSLAAINQSIPFVVL